jgi:hypothetical protein
VLHVAVRAKVVALPVDFLLWRAQLPAAIVVLT